MRLIRYEELTWPEVANLPRRLPLFIPLGDDEYDIRAAAGRLKKDEVALLPPVPFGFARRNGDRLGDLHVGLGLLRRVLRGVQRELHRQGFERVYFLDGHGLAPELGGDDLVLLRTACQERQPLPWPDDLWRRVAVVSVGHTEQHGHHLPLGTDAFIVRALAQALEAAAPSEVLCLPAWSYGVSTHTREFPGTLNLGGHVFEDFFLAIVRCLVDHGARMIYFSNAHGGNHSFLVNVVKWAGERWPQAFVATEWLHTTGPALERLRSTKRGGMGHGGELETSYMLHLRPDLVDMRKVTVETDFISTPNYSMDWIEGGRLIANPPWTDDTRSGLYGDPRPATAEKGRLWLEAAVEERLESMREIRQQHERRTARRKARGLEGGDRGPR
jgi:creatinine amidohydrolase